MTKELADLITASQFEALVNDARPTNESDYVSEARERSANQVYEILELRLGEDSPLHIQFSEYCLHATLEECLNAALAYFKGEVALYPAYDQRSITQAFDNIVNAGWEGAKTSDAGKLSKSKCYKLIDKIQQEITALKRALYQSA